MDEILVEKINKSFGELKILKDISMKCEKEKVTCILGPSGCGKSTLLNIITKNIKDYEGNVSGYKKDDVSFVFQEDRLLEWLNIYDNLKLVFKSKYKGIELKNKILESLNSVGMEKYKEFYPKELSGGMRQRISIIRAFFYGGGLLIMDEPFKSLDIKNKRVLIEDFKTLRNKNKNTVIFVTHDIEEAIELSDKIYVLSDKPTKVKKEFINVNINIYNELKDILIN
ncbi:ABC transporter ATP-binding protein [Clostridium senegalense]|uniref:ABC transporter ATP-binding protein n=1 Tax=Clostridium senegalense TaxID=1465809 RepID=A0A6M0H184_9CLOT|nr:ABC transporter ATP-binding protein [Clostridium senegalense]NEU04530.1 ABC transporter ATP-binding protein [Clostridium senegalense]